MTLHELAPELVDDIAESVVRLGRGELVDQLRNAVVVSWTFDEFAQASYLYLRSSRNDEVEETLSLYDDIGVNLDLDNNNRLIGIEVFGYEQALARIRDAIAV